MKNCSCENALSYCKTCKLDTQHSRFIYLTGDGQLVSGCVPESDCGRPLVDCCDGSRSLFSAYQKK